MVATLIYGIFDARLAGDYAGKRYATYASDASVRSFFLLSGQLAVALPLGSGPAQAGHSQFQRHQHPSEKGFSTVSVGSVNHTYNTYPIAPRQYCGTVSVRA